MGKVGTGSGGQGCVEHDTSTPYVQAPFGDDASDIDLPKLLRRIDKHTAATLGMWLGSPVQHFNLFPEAAKDAGFFPTLPWVHNMYRSSCAARARPHDRRVMAHRLPNAACLAPKCGVLRSQMRRASLPNAACLAPRPPIAHSSLDRDPRSQATHCPQLIGS